jgi:hypothetical protein
MRGFSILYLIADYGQCHAPLYTLTGICPVEYIQGMESAFEIIAEPNRRAILSLESTVDAQRRLYRLNPEPLQEVAAWLAPFRRFWSAHVDALERHLDRMDQPAATKRKRRKRR